jgi:mono/diheme cytochrome c family protein
LFEGRCPILFAYYDFAVKWGVVYNVKIQGETDMNLARLATMTLAGAFVFALTTCVYAQDDAAALYKSKCQVCHGADGKGDTPAGQKVAAKDFHSPEVAKMSDDELIEAVKKGKGKMQPYAGKLTDDQIKSLVKYIRSLK